MKYSSSQCNIYLIETWYPLRKCFFFPHLKFMGLCHNASWMQVQHGIWRTTESVFNKLELCAHYLSEFLSRRLHGIGSLLIQLFFTQWGCVEGQNLLILGLQLTTHLRETNQPFPLWKREKYDLHSRANTTPNTYSKCIPVQRTKTLSLLMIQEAVSSCFKNLKGFT